MVLFLGSSDHTLTIPVIAGLWHCLYLPCFGILYDIDLDVLNIVHCNCGWEFEFAIYFALWTQGPGLSDPGGPFHSCVHKIIPVFHWLISSDSDFRKGKHLAKEGGVFKRKKPQSVGKTRILAVRLACKKCHGISPQDHKAISREVGWFVAL